MDEMHHNQIISILNHVDDMTIATVREDGFPQATTVSYVNEGLTIYFITTADSQKAQNIEKNDKVSLTINRPYENWDEIEGLSMSGHATPVHASKETERIGTLLSEKFPQAAQYETAVDVELAFFRVEPKVISILDYKKGFGHTELVTV